MLVSRLSFPHIHTHTPLVHMLRPDFCPAFYFLVSHRSCQPPWVFRCPHTPRSSLPRASGPVIPPPSLPNAGGWPRLSWPPAQVPLHPVWLPLVRIPSKDVKLFLCVSLINCTLRHALTVRNARISPGPVSERQAACEILKGNNKPSAKHSVHTLDLH